MRCHDLILGTLSAILLLAGVGGHAQTLSPVPPEYQDLYSALAAQMTRFEADVRTQWSGSRAPVAFSAHLISANCHRGAALLEPGAYAGVLMELDSLRATGVKAISVSVHFPLLYRPFHQSDAELERYSEFYAQLAQDIRSRGLGLIVESQTMFRRGAFSGLDVGPFYASISLEEYNDGRAQVAARVAEIMRPDYLAVIVEPDTEGEQSGFAEVATATGSVSLLNQILQSVTSAGVPGVLLGAGVGTWQADYRSYVEGYANTAVDFIDMHVYPINQDYLDRMLSIADIATTYGKRIGITESWLGKLRDSELGLLPFQEMFGRDVFGFWAPLDAQFLRLLALVASHKQMDFIAPFWSGYFHSYLEYGDSTASQRSDVLLALVQAEQAARLQEAVYTSTAMTYLSELVQPADVSEPETVKDLAVQLTTASSVHVSWTAAPDNVGAAGYRVYRDGELLTTTAARGYSDSMLSDGRTYAYAVEAFDLSGNVSKLALASVTTPDMTSPSAPSNLRGSAVSPTLINLAWSPSEDNVDVIGYKVFRAASPAAMTLVGWVTGPSFSVPAAAETEYDFAVVAVDAAGNASAMSSVVQVRTPSQPDITPPRVVLVSPGNGATVSKTIYPYGGARDVKGMVYELPTGVAGVQFQVDGMNIGSVLTAPYRDAIYAAPFDTRTVANGAHTLTMIAWDGAGNRAVSSAVAIVVDNR